jgi:hypothetical protein
VCLLVEVVQSSAVPERLRITDQELFSVGVERYRVGRVSLQLQCVGTTVGRHVDDLERTIDRPIMIARVLGDDERRVLGPNVTIGNFGGDSSGHVTGLACARRCSWRLQEHSA